MKLSDDESKFLYLATIYYINELFTNLKNQMTYMYIMQM